MVKAMKTFVEEITKELYILRIDDDRTKVF